MFGYFGEVSDELRQGTLNNVKIAIENFKAISLKEAEVRGKLDVLLLKYKNLATQWNTIIDKAYYQSTNALINSPRDIADSVRNAIQRLKIAGVLTNSIPAPQQELVAISNRARMYSGNMEYNLGSLISNFYGGPWNLEKALQAGRQGFLDNTTPGINFVNIYTYDNTEKGLNEFYSVIELIKNDIGSLPSDIKSLASQIASTATTYGDVYTLSYQSKEALRQAIVSAKEIIADLPSIDEIESRIAQNLDPVTGQPLTPPPSAPPSPPVKVPDVVAIQEKPALVVAQEQPKSKLPAIAAAAAAAIYFLGGNK